MRPAALTLVLAWFVVPTMGSSTQAASVFRFTFDSPISPAIEGFGTFSLEDDPGDGTFALGSLGSFRIAFHFGPLTYTEANIATPLDEVLVVLSTSGDGRRFQFSNTTALGSGPLLGSIDFLQGSKFLTFEPTGHGIGSTIFIESEGGRGTYLAFQVVPEPSGLTLSSVGLVSFLAVAVRRRRIPA